MPEVVVSNVKIDAKYLPFLIKKDEQSIVEIKGFQDGNLVAHFADGLTGSFAIEPESEALAEALAYSGYFVIDPETGEASKYLYTKPDVKPAPKTSRTGCMRSQHKHQPY